MQSPRRGALQRCYSGRFAIGLLSPRRTPNVLTRCELLLVVVVTIADTQRLHCIIILVRHRTHVQSGRKC